MPLNLSLPSKPGLFIAGTDTGAGKTLIAGAIARILADAGMKVGVFKPIATCGKRTWDGVVSVETEFLANCANSDLSLSTITPAGYLTDASPAVSAAREKKAIDFERIAAAYKEICQSSDIVIVDGIGGVREPLTVEYDLLDLAVEFGLAVVIVVINGYNAAESTAAKETAEEVIRQCGGVDVLCVVPFDETVDIEESSLGEFIVCSLAGRNWAKLAGAK
ncbi:MAG: dethiobiotin synthase [Planctomycetota bacterium]|jgi:dethiobiotin synthetase